MEKPVFMITVNNEEKITDTQKEIILFLTALKNKDEQKYLDANADQQETTDSCPYCPECPEKILGVTKIFLSTLGKVAFENTNTIKNKLSMEELLLQIEMLKQENKDLKEQNCALAENVFLEKKIGEYYLTNMLDGYCEVAQGEWEPDPADYDPEKTYSRQEAAVSWQSRAMANAIKASIGKRAA
jgi:hypothetical protein